MRRSFRFTATTGSMLALGIGAIDYLYVDWKARSVVETRRIGLPLYAGNGLRHALAAADTYAFFRAIGLSSEWAARSVERLGQMNEYKEFYFRRPKRRDPTREIYKDLYNNAVGIFAAVRLEEQQRSTISNRLTYLGELTAQNVVMHVYTDLRVPDFPKGADPRASDLALALKTFKSDRRTIYPPILAALGSRPLATKTNH